MEDSGLPIHIINRNRVKTRCGINPNKHNISFIKNGLEHAVTKKALCKKCLEKEVTGGKLNE